LQLLLLLLVLLLVLLLLLLLLVLLEQSLQRVLWMLQVWQLCSKLPTIQHGPHAMLTAHEHARLSTIGHMVMCIARHTLMSTIGHDMLSAVMCASWHAMLSTT